MTRRRIELPELYKQSIRLCSSQNSGWEKAEAALTPEPGRKTRRDGDSARSPRGLGEALVFSQASVPFEIERAARRAKTSPGHDILV